VLLGRVRDQGLGASGTGITKHLALVKRQDQTGVSLVESPRCCLAL
jgi:hypothetical protein